MSTRDLLDYLIGGMLGLVILRFIAYQKSIKRWGEPRKCAYCQGYITDQTCIKTVDGWVHHSCEYGKDPSKK